MKTTSIKTGYLKEHELKQAIVEYIAETDEELAQHLYDNDCSMEWDDDGNFVVSIDGEVEDKEVFPAEGSTTERVEEQVARLNKLAEKEK